MEIRELRVGNIILHPTDDDQAYFVSRDMFNYNQGLTNLEDYRCIPLTEEWLYRMGFEQDEYVNGYFSFDILYIIHKKDKFGLGFPCSEYGVREFSAEVTTVHQLQNIYHSLTGKELTIKQ